MQPIRLDGSGHASSGMLGFVLAPQHDGPSRVGLGGTFAVRPSGLHSEDFKLKPLLSGYVRSTIQATCFQSLTVATELAVCIQAGFLLEKTFPFAPPALPPLSGARPLLKVFLGRDEPCIPSRGAGLPRRPAPRPPPPPWYIREAALRFSERCSLRRLVCAGAVGCCRRPAKP